MVSLGGYFPLHPYGYTLYSFKFNLLSVYIFSTPGGFCPSVSTKSSVTLSYSLNIHFRETLFGKFPDILNVLYGL